MDFSGLSSMWEYFKGLGQDTLNILYPHTDPSYFEDHQGLTKEVKKDDSVKPFVRINNLNKGEDIKTKRAIEIGIKGAF